MKHHKLSKTKLLKAAHRKHSKLAIWVTVVGSIEPIASLPIAFKIYQAQSAQEHSLFSWSFFLVSSLSWMAYGFRIKSFPVVAAGVLWSLVYIPIIIGVFIYS
ncbi:MAG: hypothetical protein U5L95_02020 [Candidatus Saccharibacteria bacterium]|nr:hypothetical protein [Candidatus Saccharibacteria bacterium]